MKGVTPIDRLTTVAMLLVISLWMATPLAAAETGQPWRATYDIVMIWVNFILLVFLLVKFLKQPIREFVAIQRNQVARRIERAEQKKAEAAESLQSLEASLAEREQRFQTLRDRIVRQGERERDELVDSAREQALRLMDTAQRRVDTHLREATALLKQELVEAAVDRVFSELPQHLGPEENQMWVDRFIDGISVGGGARSPS